MNGSKICFKCKTTKPLSEFYKHDQMADGHLNKCIDCAKDDEHKRRITKIDEIRAYDRERAKLPHRAKAAIEQTKKWRDEDKRRARCHNAVARALRNGGLKHNPCSVCGNGQSIAHHEDYDKPLDVVWLCQPCHKARHAEINKASS